MQNIQELLIKDQENISLFKSGKISIDEYKLATNEISEKFFSFYKKNGFPSKNDAEVYKAAVVLSLHQPLNNLEVIFKDINSNPNNKVEAKDVAFITDKILV
ncbi:TPA: hypothetical protein DCQ44_02185, partial [Candidatus Taylorbacteria bacterium]|nr:hypothetical protein [Candidatus Taylorbacteria bacterium]